MEALGYPLPSEPGGEGVLDGPVVVTPFAVSGGSKGPAKGPSYPSWRKGPPDGEKPVPLWTQAVAGTALLGMLLGASYAAYKGEWSEEVWHMTQEEINSFAPPKYAQPDPEPQDPHMDLDLMPLWEDPDPRGVIHNV